MNVQGDSLPIFATVLTLSIDEDHNFGEDKEESKTKIDPGTLKIYRVTGHEAISQPFRYTVELLRTDADGAPLSLTSNEVLGKPATLHLSVTDSDSRTSTAMTRNVHGVIDEFVVEEYLPWAGPNTRRRYRLVLVPQLGRLARNRQNRIHATADDQTLDVLIASKLLSRGPDYGSDEADSRIVLSEDDFRIDIDDEELPLTTLSHVTQYNETDLDFLRRLCEHHGVFFFFASNFDDSGGMVVFGNTNTPFGVIRFKSEPPPSTPGSGNDGQTLPARYGEADRLEIDLTVTGATGLVGGSRYTEPGEGAPASFSGMMYSFESVHRPVHGHVRVINDHGTGLNIDRAGHGIYTDYGTNFPGTVEADAFASIRAQELRAASNYYVGLTNSPCIAPGRTFRRMSGAGRDAGISSHFLVTEIDISIELPLEGQTEATEFTNHFRCIDFDENDDSFVFRPPRVTPVPSMSGLHTAHIATGENQRPKPDGTGAYRVHHHYADERTGLASHARSAAVRKAEPYAGEGVGMHFALKEDTEVLLAYRYGDPDRPVIAAAMPDGAMHISPVTAANPTSHVVQTASGARFEIHDNIPTEQSRVALRSREPLGAASYLRLGKADLSASGPSEGAATLEDHYADGRFNVETDDAASSFSVAKDTHDGIALFTPDNIREATSSDKITEALGTVDVHAREGLHARSLQTHLLRGRRMVMVSGSADDESHDVEDDDTLIKSAGSIYLEAADEIHLTALGASTTEVSDETRNTFRSDLHTHVYADEHKLVMGSTNVLVVGASTSLVVGQRTVASVGGEATLAGPVLGWIGFGAGLFVWPQVVAFHGVIMCDVVEAVRVAYVALEKDGSAMSIRQQLVRLEQSQLVSRMTNSAVTCVMNTASII